MAAATPSLRATVATGLLVDRRIRRAALDAVPPLIRLGYAVARRRTLVSARRRALPAAATGAGALAVGAAAVLLADARTRERLGQLVGR
jgi:hypothetical protein